MTFDIFIKYGCLRDEKFYDMVKDVILYKTTDAKYLTLEEYLEGKDKKEVYYVNDPNMQSQYVKMYKDKGLDAVELPTMMDTHFISFMEMKNQEVKFKRIDSVLCEDSNEDNKDEERDTKIIEKVKARINDETLKIEVQSLGSTDTPAILLLSEESRRMQDMYKAYSAQMPGMSGMFHDEFTLVLNVENELVKKLTELSDDDSGIVIDQIYDLARISHSPLTPEQMTKFIERSNMLLKKLY